MRQDKGLGECTGARAMASSRGILNIQSLNELTSENLPYPFGSTTEFKIRWCGGFTHYPHHLILTSVVDPKG